MNTFANGYDAPANRPHPSAGGQSMSSLSTLSKVVPIGSGETILKQQPEHSLLVTAGSKATILATAAGNQTVHVVVEEGADVVVCMIHQQSVCKSSSDVHKDASMQWIEILLD